MGPGRSYQHTQLPEVLVERTIFLFSNRFLAREGLKGKKKYGRKREKERMKKRKEEKEEAKKQGD